MGGKIKRRRFQGAVFAMLATASSALHALGLGDAHVQSFLGQPLEVRIDLISRSGEDLEGVSAGLASAADFQIVGLSRAALSVPLQFQVSTRQPEPFIRAFSTLPVNDPVVRFVVEVSFPGGRMLREYTLFLDPPTFPAAVPMPAITPRAATAAPPEPAPPPRREQAVPGVEVSAVPEPSATVPVTTAPVVSDPVPEVPEQAGPVATPAASSVTAAAPGESTETPESPSEDAAPPADPFEVAGPPETPVPEQEAPDAALAPVADVQAEQAAGEAPAEVVEPQPGEPAGSEPVAEPLAEPESLAEPEPMAEPEAEPSEPGQLPDEPSGDTVRDPADAAAPEPVPEAAEALAEPAPEAPPVVYQAPSYSGETYGPVARGETMWAIASELVQDSDYSVNQAMLAIQRNNPEAFINDNINALKSGAILRLPAMAQLGTLSKRAAMLEAMRQEEVYRARREGRLVAQPPTVRTELAEERAAAPPEATVTEPAAAAATEVVGRLQLVPPNEQGDSVEAGPGGTGDSGTGSAPGGSAEALARSEEELANARQENEYLNARIQDLEAQLAAREGTVSDSAMAELEERLRRERQAGAAETPVASVPPREQPAWYSGKGWWIGAGLLILIAAAVWLLRRFRSGAGSEADTVSAIKSEAEEVLRTLEGEAAVQVEDSGNVIDLGRYAEPGGDEDGAGRDDGETAGADELGIGTADQPLAPASEGDDAGAGAMDAPAAVTEASEPQGVEPGGEEAVELDADDPETKLDLARAYISMGDAESARAMLREVIEEGNEAQVSEARSMLTET